MSAENLLSLLTKNKWGCDPYLIWAFLTDFRGVDGFTNTHRIEGGERLQVVLECTQKYGTNLLKEFDPKQPFINEIIGFVAHHLATDIAKKTAFFSVSCNVQSLLYFIANLGIGIERIELSSARIAPKLNKTWSNLGGFVDVPMPTPASTKTVVAIIDDGLAFLHRRFRASDSESYIAYFWDQDHLKTVFPARKGSTNSIPSAIQLKHAGTFPSIQMLNGITNTLWRPVYRFGYGRELTKSEINTLLNDVKTADDETRTYKKLDYDRVAPALAHGTHVADLAAGNLNKVDESSIIMVQLPAPTVQDTSGGGTAKHVADAILYILDRVSPAARLVINLSFGTAAGPHDGTSLIERVMDNISLEQQISRDFVIVLPAGNAFNGKGHGQLSLKAGEQKDLYWNVRSDDPTESFCELWFTREAWIDIKIKVTSPSSEITELKLNLETIKTLKNTYGVTFGAIVASIASAAANDKAQVLIALATTDQNQNIYAESGIWKITVENTSSSDSVIIDAWIQRDDTPLNTRHTNRQSYFLSNRPELAEDEDDTPDDPVKRMGTGNSIAHGNHTLVVGGYIASSGALSKYTAAATNTRPDWPSVLGIADEDEIRGGVLAAGTRSGTEFRMNGTSVAAPQIAKKILKLFSNSSGRVCNNTKDLINELEKSTQPIGKATHITGIANARSGKNIRPL